MKIGLLSDTHGYLDENIFGHFSDRDEIWHAGDIGDAALMEKLAQFKPVRAVYGNIDGAAIRTAWPEHARFECGGMQVWITHIGGYPPRYNPEVLSALKANPVNIFVCGHTHILRVMADAKLNNLLYLNPGAAGHHGFHQMRTLLRFEVNNRKVSNMQVVELGRRGRG